MSSLSASSGQSHGMEFRDNEARSRFELLDGDDVVAFADYVVSRGAVVLPHTEVDPAWRGKGLGALLVGRALDELRRSGRQVVPACWFVAEFIHANPDYQDLLAA